MIKYIRIDEVKLFLDDDEKLLQGKIAKVLGISEKNIIKYNIVKRAIDSRNKRSILNIYSLDVLIENQDNFFDEKNHKSKQIAENIIKHRIRLVDEFLYEITPVTKKPTHRPVIIGTGPAGLFAGLVMAESGLNPIIIERGKDVDNRIIDIDIFAETGKLDLNSNIQFGEGGAGTFSDGKLYTLINDPRSRYIFEELVKAGAPECILYDAKPHVGTDYLRLLVKVIREKIISLGGEVRFETFMSDIIVENNILKGIIVNENETILTDDLVVAIGHSARDTVTMLYERGVEMFAKPFAVGVRIEHDADMINRSQYGEACVNPKLETARYKLVSHNKDDRSVYTFCMCPGGYVVAASSEENRLCLNGMSEYALDSGISNSALLIPVSPKDFPTDHPLAGIAFQRDLEERAFIAGGSNYHAPAQLVGDFLAGRPSTKLGKLNSTYKPGIKMTSLDECLPKFITDVLRKSLPQLDNKIKGFASHDAILTAIEARSSAVVKFTRNDKCESNIIGLYPCGEGAGFAGGITSSSIDGLRVAESIIEKYSSK